MLFLTIIHQELIFLSFFLSYFILVLFFNEPFFPSGEFNDNHSLRTRQTYSPLTFTPLHPERGPQPLKSAHVIIKPTSDQRISFHSHGYNWCLCTNQCDKPGLNVPHKSHISGPVLYSTYTKTPVSLSTWIIRLVTDRDREEGGGTIA